MIAVNSFRIDPIYRRIPALPGVYARLRSRCVTHRVLGVTEIFRAGVED